ncbi:MAG: amino acid ABC transporter substrate-binding protein [Desulfobacteraceae bacterium]|nr:amino acid ABC transporter substrate-binding protein [Desulfobacteraceae bacterium]
MGFVKDLRFKDAKPVSHATRICLSAIYLVLILFILINTGTSFAQETIRLTNGEWPPYQSKVLKHYGLASKIVTEAFAIMGVRVKYRFFPWARSYKMAKIGKWDGTLMWSPSAERKIHFHYSDTLVSGEKVFFYHKDRPFNWNTIADLKGLQIGATLEYNYGDAFHKAEKNNEIIIQWVAKDKFNFAKLLVGRINVFPNNLDAGYYILKKNFSPDKFEMITHHPKPVVKDTYHLLFSKKAENSKTMLALFNQGLKRLKAQGKFDQYVNESRRGEYIK